MSKLLAKSVEDHSPEEYRAYITGLYRAGTRKVVKRTLAKGKIVKNPTKKEPWGLYDLVSIDGSGTHTVQLRFTKTLQGKQIEVPEGFSQELKNFLVQRKFLLTTI